jgi:hypothetical protein
MKTHLISKFLLATALFALPLLAQAGTTEDFTKVVDAARATYQPDREAFMAKELPLTGAEGKAFWPLYREYRAKMEQLGDSLIKLVLEYAGVYPNLPEDRAGKLLKDYTALETKLVSTRASYLKRAGKILPPSKVLLWAQLESRLDIALRQQLASVVPLVPTAASKP